MKCECTYRRGEGGGQSLGKGGVGWCVVLILSLLDCRESCLNHSSPPWQRLALASSPPCPLFRGWQPRLQCCLSFLYFWEVLVECRWRKKRKWMSRWYVTVSILKTSGGDFGGKWTVHIWFCPFWVGNRLYFVSLTRAYCNDMYGVVI